MVEWHVCILNGATSKSHTIRLISFSTKTPRQRRRHTKMTTAIQADGAHSIFKSIQIDVNLTISLNWDFFQWNLIVPLNFVQLSARINIHFIPLVMPEITNRFIGRSIFVAQSISLVDYCWLRYFHMNDIQLHMCSSFTSHLHHVFFVIITLMWEIMVSWSLLWLSSLSSSSSRHRSSFLEFIQNESNTTIFGDFCLKFSSKNSLSQSAGHSHPKQHHSLHLIPETKSIFATNSLNCCDKFRAVLQSHIHSWKWMKKKNVCAKCLPSISIREESVWVSERVCVCMWVKWHRAWMIYLEIQMTEKLKRARKNPTITIIDCWFASGCFDVSLTNSFIPINVIVCHAIHN